MKPPFREPAGVISKDAVWVFIHDGYLYIHPWLLGLVWQVITEWRHDRHMVG